jgi:predicted nuclease of predicted toxin-antitoxin system
MRVLLDENIDRRLKQAFDSDFEIVTVTEQGWSGMKNSELLRAAEAEFDALVKWTRESNISRTSAGLILVLCSYRRGAIAAKTWNRQCQR